MQIYCRFNGQITFKEEAIDPKDAFKKLKSMQEILSNNCCGKCGGTDIHFNHREDDEGNNYYEMVCKSKVDRNGKPTEKGFPCWAKLQFGVNKNKEQTLFPKRYKTDGGKAVLDADGKKVWLPDNGWVKWDKEKGEYV